MKKLLISQVNVEDEEGDFSIKHRFTIEGEDAAYSSSTVIFKPFTAMNKLIKRNDDASKIVSESVFFDRVTKDAKIQDSAGGSACGRLFKAWGASEDDIEKSKENVKWYTFLMGEVTFPGKKPVLVNLRLTGRQSVAFGDFANAALGRDKESWPAHLIEIKAKGMQGKPQFADLVYSLKQSGLTTEQTGDIFAAVDDFIQDHNAKIIDKQKVA